MKRGTIVAATVAVAALVGFGLAAEAPSSKDKQNKPDLYSGKFFKSEESVTTGSANGISYHAIAGTLVIHPANWNDSAQNGGHKHPDFKEDQASPEASIFFVYYAKDGAKPEARPITFIYNGGPG